MATENKTQPTAASVPAFIAAVEDPVRRADCEALVQLMQAATGEPPVLWGPSIVGFGTYRYLYDSGRGGTMCITGFSPRKGDLSIYIVPGLERHAAALSRLGKHKTGKVCLYVKRLADIDLQVLQQIVADAVAQMAPQRIPTEVPTA